MLALALVLVTALAARPAASAQCGASKGATGQFFLETAPSASTDTLFVRVCLLPATGTRAASYHAELLYDSTRVRAVRVDPTGGLQAANLLPAGRVALAGVATTGFEPGLLATVAMRTISSASPGSMEVRLLELTDASGHSLASTVATVASPAEATVPAVRRAPHIDSLAPRKGEVSAEDVTEVTIFGRGFTEAGNRIYFGNQNLGVALSEGGGRRTRFHVPTTMPGRRGQLSVRIAPGRYAVRVTNANGTSNSVTFTVLPSR